MEEKIYLNYNMWHTKWKLLKSAIRISEVWSDHLISILLICIIYAKWRHISKISCTNVTLFQILSHPTAPHVVYYLDAYLCFRKMYSNHTMRAAEFFQASSFHGDPRFKKYLWISCNSFVMYQISFQSKHVIYQIKAYNQ